MNILLDGPIAAAAGPRLAEHFGARARLIEADGELAGGLAEAEVLVTLSWTRAAPPAPRLRLIQLPASGYDAIDLAAVPAQAAVCNVYEHEIGIAEHLMAGMLEFTMDLRRRHERFRAGDWSESPRLMGPLRPELAGKTLLLVGYGNIGRATAVRAQAFGMRVLAATRTPRGLEPKPDALVGYAELDRLLPEADFIAVCCPLSEETRGILGAAQFARMKPGAVVLNVGRGPVIDEDALWDALSKRRIAGAMIDTWYRYPEADNADVRPSKHPFHELDNIVMTPHLSGWSDGTQQRRWNVMIDNIERLLDGRPLRNVVKPATA